jgi:hypothetical protein
VARRHVGSVLARFLYAIAETGKNAPVGGATLVDEAGAVRVRLVAGAGAPTAESKPPLAALIKGGRLRRPLKPVAADLLAALSAGNVAPDERDSVAQTVGEACAGDRTAMSELIQRYVADPACEWLAVCLAWSGSPDAEAPLRDELVSLAGRAAAGEADAKRRIGGACRALGRLRREALLDALGSLEGAPRDAALAVVGFDMATSVDVAAAVRAPDESRRNAALASLCARIVGTRGDARASAATTTALANLLASRVEEVESPLHASVVAAANAYFYGFVPSDPQPDEERIGPYPDTTKALATLVKDVASGDLRFTDVGDDSIFDFAVRQRAPEWQTLKSAVISPQAGARDEPAPDGAAPTVELKGEVFGQWLRLALKNVGTTPISVNGTALRHGTAVCTKFERYGGPGVVRTYRRLKLTLGFMRATVATPSDRLTTLGPNEQFPWVIDLRSADRTVEHVSVEMFPDFEIRGGPPAAPLTGFTETWVK